MAYLNGNMNIMRFVTRESEAPRYKGIFPLKVDSVGGEVSEWYLYGNKQGVGEKQIVKGNLPLDFVSDGTNLENYRVYGTEDGAGETKNLLKITGEDELVTRGITFTHDKSNHTIRVNGQPTGNAYYDCGKVTLKAGVQYFLSGCPAGAIVSDTRVYQIYISGHSDWGRDVGDGVTLPIMTEDTNVTIRISIYTGAGELTDLVFKPMLRQSDTTPDFEPFGYKVPLTVTSGTESKDTDIYIGDSKLLAEEYVDYESGKIYKAKRIHEDTVTIDGIEWDILDYDHDEVYKADGTRAKHTVTIQTHDCINNLQYSERQATFAFPNGLAAGAYHFTIGAHTWVSGDVNKVLTFTLANAIPAGGQLVFNGAHNKTLVGTTISVFASATDTTAAETVTMTEGDTGTDLGTILKSKTDTVNSIERTLRGSNNWLESAMRQYLNSDKAAGSVWTPQSVFDRPPAWATTTAGFLNGKSANFISHIGTAKKTTGLNQISDGGGTAVHDEKIFLLSCSEVYMGDEYTGGEDTPYAYYKNYSDNQSPSTGEDKNRIKYRAGAAKYWWLRSPNAGAANYVRLVVPSGAWGRDSVAVAYGVAPACCIVLDDMDDWVKQTFYTENVVDLPAIETFKGENTLDSTETLGEVTITQGYQVPLDIRSFSDTNEIAKAYRVDPYGEGVTIDINKDAGIVTINGTTGEYGAVASFYMTLDGEYWYSGVPKQQDVVYGEMSKTTIIPEHFDKWDGTPPDPATELDYGDGAEASCHDMTGVYRLRFAPNQTFDNFVVKPKIQKATITDTKNIYVGNKPLGEGEMVSKESTNLDINLERGQSVLETTITNKPEMIVTPDSYDKIKDMLLNTKQYDYNETQSDTITDQVTEVTQ